MTTEKDLLTDGEQYIYILLTDTGTLLSRTIKAYTEAPYNHASLALGKDLLDLYSFGRKQPRNPLNAGFVREDIVYGTYKLFPNTKCAIYRLKVDKRTFRHIQRIISHFERNRKHYSYNLTGLFGVMVNYPVQRDTSYFCSQFVAYVLDRAHIPISYKEAALVTPNDFRDSDKLELIYEGKLYDYVESELSLDLPFLKKKDLNYKTYLFDEHGNFKYLKF